ncbi:MAG: TonB-dependent receptor, partial [Gammaproteobacteria bacterium]
MIEARVRMSPRRAGLGLSLLAGSSLCAAAWIPASHAEAAADSAMARLEEVVVSARKRDESMQSIPIAISVLTGELLRDGNLDELNDFIDLIPNATFTQDSGTSSEISIRGSGRNMAEEDPGVGLNKDGVYVGGLLFSTAVLYDLARVEILRGPQAGLYGRNAVGGAVNIISERPDFNHQGYVELQLASKERRELRAAVNVPLVEDRWAIRLAGLFIDQQEGFDYLENQDRFPDAVENNSVRLRSLFRPSEHLEFLTTFEWFERDGGAPLTVLAPGSALGYLDSTQTIPYPGTQVEDTLHQQRDLPEFRRLNMWHAIQEMNWQLPKGTLTGIVSYRDAALESQRDEDMTIHRISEITYDAGQESLFAELRFASVDLGGFRFLTGVNYLDEDVKLNNRYAVGSNFAGALGGANIASAFELGYFDESWAPLGIPAGTPITIFGWTPFATGWGGYLGDTFPTDFVNEQTLESIAVFVEADYALTERVRLWGNARYARDEKSIDFAQTFGLPESRCPIACPQVFGLFLGLPDPEV